MTRPWFAAVLLITTCALRAGGQVGPDRYPVTFSLSPASPEVAGAGGLSPSSILFAASATSALVELWTPAELGLMPAQNIDAASDGKDSFPLPGLTCRTILVEYTVTPSSSGAAGSLVHQESTGGTADTTAGAAGDVFAKEVYVDSSTGASLEAFYHMNDSMALSSCGVGPQCSDIDALLWSDHEIYPVYLSLDAATPGAYSGAHILRQDAPGGTLQVHLTPAQLGLTSSDDVDALAVDEDGRVLFSLTSASPSLTGMAGPYFDGSGADLYHYDPVSGTVVRHYAASELDLLKTDDINGIRITDPGPSFGNKDSNQFQAPPNNQFPYSQLRVNGTAGGVQHVVTVPCQGPAATFVIDLLGNETLLLCLYPGEPCFADSVFVPKVGTMTFLPFIPPFVVAPGPAPLSIPIPTQVCATVTVQGILAGGPNGPRKTNAITIRIE